MNKYYERAIYLCQQINDNNRLDKILSKLTDVFKNENNFYLAIIILTFLNNKYKQFHDRENEIKSLFNIAEYHEYDGDFRYKNNNCSAYYIYEEALQTYNKIPKKIETITM